MKKHLTFSLALFTIVCSTVTAQLPSYLPADGLVGWWPFNGNANDESGNGNDGVVNGATLTEDRFGNAQSGYYFSGSGCQTRIDISNFNYNGTVSNFSMSFWMKKNGNGCLSPRLFEFGNGNGWGVNWVNGFSSMDWVGNTVLENNQWYHVVYVLTPGSIQSYVNGNFDSTFPISNSIPAWFGQSVCFGRMNHPAYDAFNGNLDDISVYTRALTPQEIQNLYTGSNETVDTGDGAAPLPQGIPYQAAARDAQGQVIADAPVNVRFSLHEGAVDGAVSYSETHALTANSIGLFNTVFGNGAPEQSAFDSINWAATTKFLQVEIDLGDGYVDMGTTQLLSVPYAFRSDEAARIKNAGLPIFADNAAALAGGLVAGEMYRTASGDLKVVY